MTEKTKRQKLRSLNISTPETMSHVQKFMSENVIQQDEAVMALADLWRIQNAGLNEENRPLGSVMLLGPTGVGKTHLIESFAEAIHGSKTKMIKINCAELQASHEIAKLVGSPPGYLGHRETQPLLSSYALSDATSNMSDVSIILFDEIEKAHENVWRFLLGILDKGEMSTGDNGKVNFTRSMIFMTSNLGVTDKHIGFDTMKPSTDPAEGQLMEAVRRTYSPEFINRLDLTIEMKPLGEEAIRAIMFRELGKINARIGGNIILSNNASRELCVRGYSKKYGAREMKRALTKYVTVPLANAKLNGEFLSHVHIDHDDFNDEFTYKTAVI